MMDMLKANLEKEVTEAKAEEADSQRDYELYLKASAEKRETDLKAVTENEAVKAGVTEELNTVQKTQAATMKDLGDIVAILGSLHKDCDFLLKSYDVRKESRANEIEGLNKAKAVLAGADFSMTQTSASNQ